MINSVTCPSCGKPIELTEALVHKIQEQVLEQVQKQHFQELEKIQRDTAEKIKRDVLEKTTLEMTDLKKQLEEKARKLDEMRNEELRLRQEKRRLEEKEKDLALEVDRKIDEEKRRIEETVLKQTSESFRMKELEYEKKLKDMTTALEDAQRKASQGSQQLQGEVQELDLEAILRELFPNDTIEPVGKGIRGADIAHTVKSPRGLACGVILWESKRTKAWSDEWAAKLKEDMRAAKAHIPVIVTSVLPQHVSVGMGLYEGVWVTTHALVPAIASLLRKNLLDVAFQKAVFAHQGEKADLLYEYITGHEFRQQVEAIVEVYQDMQTQITREKIAFEKSWKMRETQLLRMIRSTANIYGSMQGVIGGSLPQLKGLELEDNDEQDQRKLL